MRRISFGLGILGAVVIVTTAAAQQPYGAVQGDKGDHVTVTGCVVKGDGGYLLTEVANQSHGDWAPARTPPDSTIAASPAPHLGQILYWLDNEDKLKGHEGQRVEVEGKLEGDLKKGEMEIKRKDDRVEIEAKAGGKKVKAVLPESSAPIATSGRDRDKVEMDYLVRRFEVKDVKMITSTCR